MASTLLAEGDGTRQLSITTDISLVILQTRLTETMEAGKHLRVAVGFGTDSTVKNRHCVVRSCSAGATPRGSFCIAQQNSRRKELSNQK